MDVLAGRERWLAIATGLLFFVSVVGLGVVDGGDSGNTVASGSGVTTTSVAGPGEGATDTTVAAGDPSATTASTGAPTPTSRGGGAPTTAPAAAGPGRPQVTREGTWRYRAVTKTQEGERTTEIDYDVANRGGANGAVDQRHTLETEGGEQINDVSWRADGTYLVANSFGTGDSSATCTWKPSILVTKMDLQTGAEWSTDSMCDLDFGQSKGTARRVATTKVEGSGVAVVDGQSFPVWKLHTVSKITFDVSQAGRSATVVIDEVADEEYAPSLGLSVRAKGKGEQTVSGRKTPSERELVLLTAAPS